MRGLKVAVTILAAWSVALTLFALILRRDSIRNRESMDGLTELLENRRWEVPMPKDARLEWSFDIRDYRASKEVESGTVEWMDPSRKANNIRLYANRSGRRLPLLACPAQWAIKRDHPCGRMR